MTFKKSFSLYLALLFFFPISLQAQTDYGWEFGAWGGVSSYYGDLNPMFSFRRVGPSLGAFARKNFDGRLCFRMGLSYGNVGANDANSPFEFERARNLSFHSHLFEGSAIIEFNFQNFHSNLPRNDKWISPYLLAGFGITHFNPKTRYNDAVFNLRDMGTEGQAPNQAYALITPVIISGIGLKIDLNPSWSINIEISHRFTFTDYLDDVSGSYADFRLVEGYHGATAAALSDRSLEVGDLRIGESGRQRGDSKAKDTYIFGKIGIVYRMIGVGCPAY